MTGRKTGNSALTKQHFDHLLAQVHEIRMSERKFYQKITDIYATALDYDISQDHAPIFCRGTEQAPLGNPLPLSFQRGTAGAGTHRDYVSGLCGIPGWSSHPYDHAELVTAVEQLPAIQ